ncbi:carbon-nitrogen hydrolase [Fennellomyces sp. T-0311]|nr:carbon-nitrogen hydrolase [Fennellomyces sp. T-0311]
MAYSSSVVYGFSDIVQAATWLGGRPMIDFVMTLFATVVQEFNTSTYKPIFNGYDDDEETHHSNRRHPWLFHPATWYTVFITLLAIFGGVQNDIYHGTFFQVGYPEFVPKTIPVGCVLGPGGIDMPLQTDYDRWFEYSASLADAGAKLIMWSEEVAATDGFKEETMLINKAQSLAQDKDVYLVITYDRITPPNAAENKLVLITPQGDVAINYSKSHPVPIVEPITAGNQELQYIDTPEFGRVGAAICYDYTFPWFIRQASDKDIDVMLQASWTWGPLGTYHSKSNSLRPVENGFMLVRCASQGVSGIYEPILNGIFSQRVAGVSDSAYLFHLPIRRRWRTFYGFTGDAFGVWCVCIGVLVLVSLLLPFRCHSRPFLR